MTIWRITLSDETSAMLERLASDSDHPARVIVTSLIRSEHVRRFPVAPEPVAVVQVKTKAELKAEADARHEWNRLEEIRLAQVAYAAEKQAALDDDETMLRTPRDLRERNARIAERTGVEPAPIVYPEAMDIDALQGLLED